MGRVPSLQGSLQMHGPWGPNLARLRGRVADEARRIRLARVQVRRAQERPAQQVR